MNSIVRPIEFTEIDLLTEIECDCFGHVWGVDLFGENLPGSSRLSCIGLFRDSSLVSYVLACVIIPEAEILRVGTLQPYRNNGHAQHLLRSVIEIWREAGVRSVWLEVRESNLAACGLYVSLGFKQTRRRKGYYSLSCKDGNSSLISEVEDGLDFILSI